jgi:hypothetical protein
MEEPDGLDTYIDTLINTELNKLVIGKIAPYTCQFLKQDTEKGLLPFASGVLAELGGNYYILTASHVIEDWSDSNKLFVEIRGGHVSVVGKAFGTEENEDKLDITYIKLKPTIVPLLQDRYQFLTIDRFLEHSKSLIEADYCAYGYPVAYQKRQNDHLKPLGMAHWCKSSKDKVFLHYGFNPLTHYVIDIQGKGTNIKTGVYEKIKSEHYGLSGGGLWYTQLDYKRDKFISDARLIGIMIEFRKGKYHCLIANRIEIILAAIQLHEGVKVLPEKKRFIKLVKNPKTK